MKNPTHDFVTVEMRGLKAALVARARAQCAFQRSWTPVSA
jgi:hypothetical protein